MPPDSAYEGACAWSGKNWYSVYVRSPIIQAVYQSSDGLLALRKALERLGYVKCYHMMSASVENPPDCLMWHDALCAKYDGVGEFGRKEWDQLLGDCQVCLDD